MSTTEVQRRVARGAEILDRKYGPEWRDKIDTGSLEMSDTCNCVLGQLYDGGDVHMDGFDAGMAALRIKNADHYGFETADWEQEAYTWKDLHQAWLEELQRV